jgi:RimJ/RimL family protein N-acetyltransferase
VRAFVNRFLLWEGEEPQRRFAFGVSLTESPTIIGICSLRRESAEATDAEIGFELAKPFWGQGLGSEMGTKMLWLGFEGLGLHRVEAHCVSENDLSRRVLERIGMRLEGRLRDKQMLDGRFHDELWFGMLRPEWTAMQGEEDLISGAA